ncbi:MAG: Coenzyme F420 hydrogenase/dehydrogenase, beta subunit C-terminal domain [Candidatus Krumholzibacteria bacterium]|nr:Coenzyme F420 hydrogenase/dehydrogenase, beta subunit C-terminal domain [Candidatus Krumholzibacteria bacterium]
MISYGKDDKIHFEVDRCCQCGACLAGCASGALSRDWIEDGRFRIIWDEASCISCGLCVRICPVPLLSANPWKEMSWTSIASSWLSHSTDPDRRRNSSSGGVIRTLIESALNTGIVDEAYCLVDDTFFPWVKGGYVSRGFRVEDFANSTYRPVPVLENLEFSRPREGKLIVVGTNCQLIALDNFYGGKRDDLIMIGVFCKQQKNEGFTRFMRGRMGLDREGEGKVSYRGKGWPGKIEIEDRTIEWADAAALPFGKGLWTLPACRLCPNPMGAGADITVADPWNIVRSGEVGGGLSLVIVHSERGRELLTLSSSSLESRPVTIEDVKQSVDWPGLRRKNKNTRIRAGCESGTLLAHLKMRMDDMGRICLEKILNLWTPPRLILKILAKIPIRPW